MLNHVAEGVLTYESEFIRAYVEALRDGRTPDDSRIGPSAPLDWLVDVHDWQVQAIAERR